MRQHPNTPAQVFPPGEFILDELHARGWSLEHLARTLGVEATLLAGLVGGSEPITPDLAARLGGAFGTSHEFWMNLEAVYRAGRSACP